MRIAHRPQPAAVTQSNIDEADDFVAAPPPPKPEAKPKPVQDADDFEPTQPKPEPKPAKPPPPKLSELVDTAPKAYQEMALKEAGVDDELLGKMTDAQIADAFKQLVEQAGKVGKHSITLHYTKNESVDAGGESGGSYNVQTEMTKKLSFTSKSVGDVNGMKLDAGAVAATKKTVQLLDSNALNQTLEAMGFSGGYLDEQASRDLLTSALVAARTPGKHEISMQQQETVSNGGDDGGSHTETRTYTLKFESDKRGVITVGGKPLPTAEYIAMSQTIESLPTDQQRAELVGAGFPQDKVAGITPEEVHRALTHVSLELARPGGVKEFEVMLGGDDFRVSPKLDTKGKLESLEISEKPKKKSRWKKFTDGLKKIAGPVLTVLSFIPVTAPFAIAINAAMSVVNGIKNHNPLGIIAGIAGGVAGFAGNLASSIGEAAANTVGSVAQTVANVANTVQAGMAAVKNKNPGSFLGFIASAAGNIAGFVGDGAQGVADTMRDVSTAARTAQTVYNGAQAIRNRDLAGVVGAGQGLVNQYNRSTSPSGGQRTSSAPQTASVQQAASSYDGDSVPFENDYPVETGGDSVPFENDYPVDDTRENVPFENDYPVDDTRNDVPLETGYSVDEDGYRLDANGDYVMTEDGYYVDADGYLVDENGEYVVDENGDYVLADSAPIGGTEPTVGGDDYRVDADGMRVDANGDYVLDENGYRIDENGRLVDDNGDYVVDENGDYVLFSGYTPADERTDPNIAPIGGVPTTDEPLESVIVSRGDTLSSLAEKLMGDPKYAAVLYTYNKDLIGPNGNLLQAGAELQVPPPGYTITREENNAFWRNTYQQPAPELEGAPGAGAGVDVDRTGEPLPVDRRQMYDLEKDFNKVLAKMTADGRRIDAPGWANNLYGTGQVISQVLGPIASQVANPANPIANDILNRYFASIDPVAGCQGQAIEMSSVFNSQLKKEYPGWSFSPISNFPEDASELVKYAPGSGYHWVIEATSPDGHRYMLDPNNGYMDSWSSRYDAWRYKAGDDASARNAEREEELDRLLRTMPYGA